MNSTTKFQPWTPVEDAALRGVWCTATGREAARLLGRTVNAVYQRAYKLNLPVKYNAKTISPSRYRSLLESEAVAAGVPLERALSPRNRAGSQVRWRVWKGLHKEGASLSGIGRVAGVDHTTIRHGIHQ